jgi:phage terminase large subunit-like protein
MASALAKRLDYLERQADIASAEDTTASAIQDRFESLYDWQLDFAARTKDKSEVCLCAANRIGKTYTGTFIDAVHATGEYPDGWEGHRFEHAPLIWCLGYSGEKTRDLLQKELFGQRRENAFEGGLIPANRIVSWESMTGTPNAMRTVRVKHASGGLATIQFWSYSQGQHALMGDSVDFFHIDEEPKDQAIYPQVITRTATGDKGKGGRGILTFTPENGRTDLVIKFMDSPGPSQYFIQKGWDDAPHLSDDVKEKLLESFPAHQREMRTKGVPMLGHGRIYDFAQDFIECDPFEIPDHWHVIGGMDFGWDHPQAHVRLAMNMDTEDIYLTHAWKKDRVSANDAWGAVKAWQKDVPVAWPHDGLMHEKGRDDAKQQKDHYQDAGFKMLAERATFDGSSNSVEQGIYEIRQLMQTGKFKVFRGAIDFFDEFSQYHRDEKGRIVKVRDDILDAVRYAYMMRRFAKPLGLLGVKPVVKMPPPLKRYRMK